MHMNSYQKNVLVAEITAVDHHNEELQKKVKHLEAYAQSFLYTPFL